MRQNKKLFAILVCVALLVSVFAACNKHTHVYDKWDNDANQHWKVCAEDNEIDDTTRANHADANNDGKCDVCGYEMGVAHTHTYGNWQSNAQNHWKECTSCHDKDATTEAAHADADDDGRCDVCGYEIEAIEFEITSLTVDTTAAPTVVVTGRMPYDTVCLKLNAEANGVNYYALNTATTATHFEFRFDLTQIPLKGTPWTWFRIYEYDVAEPVEGTEPINKVDIERGSHVADDAAWEANGISYKIVSESGANGIFVVQPNAVIGSVTIDATDVPTVVVTGKMPAGMKAVKLHADGNGNHYYGAAVAANTDGTFEAKFALNTVPVDGTPWCFFHVYFYDVENPTDTTEKTVSVDLARGSEIATTDCWDYDDVRYKVVDNNQLVLWPNPAPSFEVTSVAMNFDENGAPTLVVRGTVPTTVACIKLHADGNDHHVYGDNYSATAGEFSLHLQLTELTVDGTPWFWFHIYTYDDAEPTDLSAFSAKHDLQRGNYFRVGDFWDRGDVRYTVINQGQVCIQPTAVPQVTVTDVTVETDANGVPTLVVKGDVDTNVPCIKLHAKGNDKYFYWVDNVAAEEGKFEFRFNLTQLTVQDTPWYFFEILSYNDAEPSDLTAKAKDFQIYRRSYLEKDESWTYNGVKYTVQDQVLIVIQPTNA